VCALRIQVLLPLSHGKPSGGKLSYRLDCLIYITLILKIRWNAINVGNDCFLEDTN
jgi:hypothetical protein